MSKSVQILLVEGNELDVRMILHSVKNTKLRNTFTVVNDGTGALQHLKNCADDELRDLILLDLSLPGIGGLALLKILKDESRLRAITVVVLTSSAASTDIKAAMIPSLQPSLSSLSMYSDSPKSFQQ